MSKGVYIRRKPAHNKLAACGVCGSTDRYPSRRCRPCQMRRNAASLARAKVDLAHRAKLREYAKRGDRKLHGRPIPTHPCPGHCECCGGIDPKSVGGFHEDHDHKTGKFRGWLCGNCNRGIGYLRDCIAGVNDAKLYLQRSEE